MFFMIDSTDHVSGKTGLSPSVSISKAGGSFASAGGTVSEVGSGWYKIALTTTDTNTLGDLAFQCTATGADPTSFVDQVVAFNPLDSNLGLTNLDATISSRAPAATALNNTTWTDTKAGYLDVAVSSRAPSATALSNATWTDAKAAYLDASISSRSTLTAADVWGYTTRTLTSFGTLVSDIWNAASRTLTGFSTSLAVSVWDVLESAISTASSIGLKVKTNLDARVSTRSTLGTSDVAGAVWNAARSSYNSAGTFGQGVASVQGNVTGSVGSVSSGVTISGTKTTLDALNDITAASVWSVAVRSLTDKSGFELSNAGIDAIWDRASAVTLSFENLLIRAYEILNNKMTVNETTGAVKLRNIGDTADIATGSVVSASGTTTRSELSWA